MWKTALTWAAVALGALLAAPANAATCHNTGSYERWLEAFKREAVAQGISPRVVADASPSMTFDPAIVRRDHGQAVFNQTFLQFSDRMVGGARIPNGLKKIQQHAALFARFPPARQPRARTPPANRRSPRAGVPWKRWDWK